MKTDPTSPWRTVKESAAYLKCGPKVIYRECLAGRLRHASIGGRGGGEIRIHTDWLDEFLETQAPVNGDRERDGNV
jgi:excisionase family DNA binding protein